MPSTRTWPRSGLVKVAMIRTRVVLPAPFGPSSAVIVPAGIVRSTPPSAVTEPKFLATPTASTAGSVLDWLIS